jgi:hypothetical protein
VYVVDTGLGRDIACESNTANAFAFRHTFFKSRGSNSAKTIVSAGDELGLLNFYGYDGTAYIGAAAIRAYVDTTPAAGDMPGKLSFFTTKDGTSTLTEALIIDSLQRFQFNGTIGIGAVPGGDTGLKLSVNATGATTTYGFRNIQTIQSDVTTTAHQFISNPNTAAAVFNLTNLNHYSIFQGTIGSGSAVATQRGFFVNQTFTGATNNYAFVSDLAAGTGRYNLYMTGTADNYLSGNLALGDTGYLGSSKISVSGNISLGISPKQFQAAGVFQTSATTDAACFRTVPSIVNSAFTLPILYHFAATQGTYGASASLTTQYGFYAGTALIGATNNYGFFGNLAAGTGRYNLYMGGTADNYLAGKLQVDNYLLINYGSTQYSGMSIRNIYGNATRKGTSFLDFQNESSIATGHIF